MGAIVAASGYFYPLAVVRSTTSGCFYPLAAVKSTASSIIHFLRDTYVHLINLWIILGRILGLPKAWQQTTVIRFLNHREHPPTQPQKYSTTEGLLKLAMFIRKLSTPTTSPAQSIFVHNY